MPFQRPKFIFRESIPAHPTPSSWRRHHSLTFCRVRIPPTVGTLPPTSCCLSLPWIHVRFPPIFGWLRWILSSFFPTLGRIFGPFLPAFSCCVSRFPPTVCWSVPPAASWSVPPAASWSVPPAASWSVPPAASWSVPPAASWSVPPAASWSVPPAASWSVPPAASWSVPPTASWSVPPAASWSVPPAASWSVPPGIFSCSCLPPVSGWIPPIFCRIRIPPIFCWTPPSFSGLPTYSYGNNHI